MESQSNKSLHNLRDDSKPPSGNQATVSINVQKNLHFRQKTSLQFQQVNLSFPQTQSVTSKEPINKKCSDFRRRFYPGTSFSDWNSWQWQLQNRIRKIDDLKRIVNLSEQEENALIQKGGNLPLAITPYYAHLIDRGNPHDPIRKSVIPIDGELITSPGESSDPLGEENSSPVHGIVHRYPDRVLFLITDYCSVFCRYCTRSRLVGGGGDYNFSTSQWEAALQYIEATPTIRDVLISGGDPLTLAEDRLEYLLKRLKAIPHVEFIRIGTKVPVVLPQKITPSLVRMLKRYHPLWISINFVHPQELTMEVAKACERLADAGIPLGSQTVLLKSINDQAEILKELFHGLLKIRVRPYYLYQCDPIQGSSHFRTPLKRGLQIMEQLRGFTTGYAVPTFVVDAPGGGGKIAVAPKTIIGNDKNGWKLRNYQGKTYSYPEQLSVNDNNEY